MPNGKLKDVYEHIEKTNYELGCVKEDVAVLKAKISDMWKISELLLTLQAGTFILILSHILKIV